MEQKQFNSVEDEIPTNFVRVKPNQVVVLDRYYPVNDFEANAFFVSEETGFVFFDTKSYLTDGEIEIYGK